MAITINEDAIFYFSPNPKMPNEKMVGNIIDIKKKPRKTAATEIHPILATQQTSVLKIIGFTR
jgi:hypothetical protein